MRDNYDVLNNAGLKTTEECRNYFNACGLTYNDIKEDDIKVLYIKCVEYVKQANKNGSMSVNTMRMSTKLKIEKNRDGSIKCAFMYINSHYFTQREAISFNHDGFIGFAGWADSGNTQPFIDAFIEWCDWLKEVGK